MRTMPDGFAAGCRRGNLLAADARKKASYQSEGNKENGVLEEEEIPRILFVVDNRFSPNMQEKVIKHLWPIQYILPNMVT